MDDLTVVTLVMAGIALVIATSWQLAGRKPFDAIEFTARLAMSFIGAAAMAALLYGLVFVIGLSNIAGSQTNLNSVLTVCFWMSIGIAFVLAISPPKTESRSCSASSRDGSGHGSTSSASASCCCWDSAPCSRCDRTENAVFATHVAR